MGYTHYFDTERIPSKDLSESLKVVRHIVKRYKDILAYEDDQTDKPAKVGKDLIRFNGRGEGGHETFLFLKGERGFCKTARKPYDIAVCEVLLVLKAYYPSMVLESDGFSSYEEKQIHSVQFDGEWNRAIENVSTLYGIVYEGTVVGSRNGGLHVDLEPRLQTFNPVVPTKAETA